MSRITWKLFPRSASDWMSPLPMNGSSSVAPPRTHLCSNSLTYLLPSMPYSIRPVLLARNRCGVKIRSGPSTNINVATTPPTISNLKSVSFAPVNKIGFAISPANIAPCAISSGDKAALPSKEPDTGGTVGMGRDKIEFEPRNLPEKTGPYKQPKIPAQKEELNSGLLTNDVPVGSRRVVNTGTDSRGIPGSRVG